MQRRAYIAILFLLALVATLCLPANAQLTTITMTTVQSADGLPLALGVTCWTGANNAGTPISYRAGSSGQVIAQPVCRDIINGAVQTTYKGATIGVLKVADTLLSSPLNLCYKVTVTNTATGRVVLGSFAGAKTGYDCVQPTGTTWSFDTYTPAGAPGVTQVAGPVGPAGPIGPAGPAGTTTATGVNGDFTVPGTLTANATAPLAGLARIVSTGASTGVLVVGDSTGNETTEWPYLFMTYLRGKLSAAYSIKYWLWNDTTKDYSAPTVIQTGTAGTQRTMNLTGSVNGARLLHSEVPTFTASSMDLRAHLCLASWRPASQVNFISKYTEPFREVRVGLQSSGALQVETTPTGSSAQNDLRVATAAVPDAGANGCQWVRVTWNAGSINFYSSSDSRYYSDASTTWTQAGTTVTSPNSSFYAGPGSDWTFGLSTTGTADGVEIRDGVNGPVLNARNIDAWVPLDTGTTFTGAPEFNVINGSMPGAGIAYFTAPAAAGFSTPNWSQSAIFVSLSHNELSGTGAGEMANYGTLFKQITKYVPLGHLVVLTQNPRTSPATNLAEQAIRRAQLMSWNSSPVGYDLIDTYGAFLADSRWATSPSTLVNSADGIHPTNGNNVPGNTEGMKVWEAAIEAAYARSAVSTGSVYSQAAQTPSVWPVTQGGTGVTTSTGSGSVVLSTSPTFAGTVTAPSQFLTATRRLQLAIDTDTSGTMDIISCGLTVDQNCYTTYRGHAAAGSNGTAYFQVGMTSGHAFSVFDDVNNMNRFFASSSAQTRISGLASGVEFGNDVGSVGVTRWFSGGATPTQVAVMDATGALFFSQVGSFNGKLHGTWTASRDFNFPDASGNVSVAVNSGTSAMGTSAIAAGTCATVVTTAAGSALSTDTIMWNFNAAPGTGYTAGLHILPYVTAGNVNFLVCNPTAASLTPAAATLNWKVTR